MIPAAAKTLRCSIHGYDFPPREEFTVCPECGEETRPFFRADPMTDEEANSIKSHADFEAYLERNGR